MRGVLGKRGEEDAIRAAAEEARAHLRAEIERARTGIDETVGDPTTGSPQLKEGSAEVDALREEFAAALSEVRRDLQAHIQRLERRMELLDELAVKRARREAKRQLRRTRRGDREADRLLEELSEDVREIHERLPES